MASAWCGLLETTPGLTPFSQEPHTDSHDEHQDPIWVQGISLSAWNPVFEDGCTWSVLTHLAPLPAQSYVCWHMAWHPLQVLVPLNPVLDICVFLHEKCMQRAEKTTEQKRYRLQGGKKKKKDRLIGTEYVLRQTEEEEGTDVQPGSKLGVSKVKLDV